jgi:hypothetical protein
MDDELLSDDIELEPDLPPGQEPEEGEPARRNIKRSAVAQGALIPTGWKPTYRNPVPVVRCHHIFKDTHPKAGERCAQWSLRGSRLCWVHAGRGNLKNVEEYRQSIIEAARLRLADAVPEAMDTLFDLMANSGADNVRLKAVEMVLDRNGLKGGQEIDVKLEVTDSLNPAQTLAERLSKLKDAADAVAAKQAQQAAAADALALEAGDPSLPPLEDDSDVIDVEVVSDTADPEPRTE